MAEDKRKYRRYPFMAIASLNSMSNGARKTVTSIINNISYSGVGMTSYTPFTMGTPVSIRVIKIMGADNNEILNGIVTYSYKQHDSYYMGISLKEDLHPDEQPKLYEHFSKTMKFI
jgi:hypothetical protein